MRILSIVGIFLLASSLARGESVGDSLRDRVDSFCATEFKGDQINRTDFFSHNVPDNGYVGFATEPVDIVATYKVIAVTVIGDSATVTVEYDLLGELRNVTYDGYPGVEKLPGVKLYRADKLTSMRNPKYRQKLSWEFNRSEGKWYLASSPIPKISKGALLELLHAEVKQQTEILRDSPGRSLSHIEVSRAWNIKKIKLVESVNTSTKLTPE